MRRSLRHAWLILLIIVASALAHTPGDARVFIDNDDGRTRIEYDVALTDIQLAFDVDADHDGTLTWGEVAASEARISAQWRDALQVSAAGNVCAITAGALALRDYSHARYASLDFIVDCPAGSSPDELRSDFLFDSDLAHRVVVLIDDDGDVRIAVLSAAQRVAALSVANGGAGFTSYFKEGIHHILIGYDHLAFLGCLLIAVMRLGEPRTLRNKLIDAAWVASAFTLAHSLTLTLATLDVVVPASRPTEIAIAASVAIAALLNLRNEPPFAPIWLAFGFGLIHGFGFAGALGELGLPERNKLLALIGFNLGVEAGQIAVIIIVLPLLFVLARSAKRGARVMTIASLALAAIGLFWMIERLIG